MLESRLCFTPQQQTNINNNRHIKRPLKVPEQKVAERANDNIRRGEQEPPGWEQGYQEEMGDWDLFSSSSS